MSTEVATTNSPKDNIKARSEETAETLKDEASQFAGTAREATESLAKEKAEEARAELVAGTDNIESAVNDVAATLGEHSDTLGHYASEFADNLSTFNDRIKNRSLDELASDARSLARDNPAMFILGAVTVGAIAARFFQSSQPRSSTMTSSSNNGYVSPVADSTVGRVPGSVNTTGGYRA